MPAKATVSETTITGSDSNPPGPMETRTSASARILAALALVGAVLVMVVVIASSTGGDSSSDRHHPTQTATQKRDQDKPPPARYVVEAGDTLTSIARETGVPVAEIVALNPEVDPQILIAGQTLKLR
jgi:LysM repeat protein